MKTRALRRVARRNGAAERSGGTERAEEKTESLYVAAGGATDGVVPATASSGLRGAGAAAEEDQAEGIVEGENPEDGDEDAPDLRFGFDGDRGQQEQEPDEADGADDARDGAAPKRADALDEGHAREDVRGHGKDAEPGAVGEAPMDGEAEVPDDYRAQEEQDEGGENLGEDDQASRGAAAGGGRGMARSVRGHGFAWMSGFGRDGARPSGHGSGNRGWRGGRARAEEDIADEAVEREKDGNDRDDSSGLGGKIKAECDQREPGETRGEENADGGASPERQEDFKKGDVGQSMHCRDADLDSEFRDADARHLIVASGDVHAQEEKGERHEGFCEDDESTEPLSAERSGGGRRGMRHCVLAGAEPGRQDSAPESGGGVAGSSAGGSSPGFLRGFLT